MASDECAVAERSIVSYPNPQQAADAAAWAESDAPTIRPDARPQRGSTEGHEDVRAMLERAAAGDPDSEALLARLD